MRSVLIQPVMLALLIGIGMYIARRIFRGLKHFFPKLRFRWFAAAALLTTALMLLGFANSRLPVSDEIKNFLNNAGMIWMGVYVYLLMYTVVADMVTILLRICRLPWAKTTLFRAIRALAVLVLTMGTAVYGWCHVNDIQHVQYEVHAAGKADVSDMNIVLISDLHLGAIGSEARLGMVVEEINSLKPDVLCIAGDFFDTDFAAIEDPEKAIATLRQLSATYGVYACLGNHDAGKTAGQMQDFLEQCGIQLLMEEYVVIDGRLTLAGRLDRSPIGGYGQVKRGDAENVLAGHDRTLPLVVMDHNPAHIGKYTNEVDLILSGHTHKGQLFPANFVTDRMYEVHYGYYQRDAQSPQVIVTSGVGYWGMPMRVGTDCEIVQVRILP